MLGFTTQSILALLAVAVVLAVVAGMTASRMRRRDVPPEIPPAMAAGPSDADLEKPVLEKLQVWATVCFVFFAVWMPIYWLVEPTQNVTDENLQTREAEERGKETTELFEEGVNELGFGCIRCHGDGLTGGTNFFQGRFVPVPDLTQVCGHRTYEQVQQIIREGGGPNSDMPSWSIREAGPLNDQQINDIVQYLLTIQDMPDEENLCLNPPTEEG